MNKRILILLLFVLAVPLLLMSFGTGSVAAQGQPQPTQGLLRFNAEDAIKFQVSGPGKSVAFTKQADGMWLADPREYAPYEKVVTATIQHLSRLQGTQIAPGAGDVAPYGLVTPTLEVTVFLTTSARSLKIGNPGTEQGSYYASVVVIPPDPGIYLVGNIVDELKNYLEKPAPVSTRTPTPTLTKPPPAATGTATPTQTPTSTPPPAQPVTPTIAPPPTLPPSSPSPTPPTPTPNFIEELGKFALENQGVAAGVGGGCLLALLVFLILIFLLLRRWRKREPPLPTGAYLDGLALGFRFDLTGERMTLGRASDCDLAIPEDVPGADTVSEYHALFEKRGERWVVTDGVAEGKLSTNGVFVNGKRTLENYLTENDEIRFGEVKFQFHAQPLSAYPVEGGQR